MATYTYSNGSGFTSSVDAATAGAAIAALDNGFDSTAQQVLDAAADPASALHGIFTWTGIDQTAAALSGRVGNEDRLEQAQALLNAIVVTA